MITKFDSLYAGHVDLDNVGYAGTPINDRRYDNAHLATALEKAQSMAVLMDGLGYNAFWMAEHHFQREGTECIPNVLMMALHLTHVTKNLKIGCGFNIAPMWHPLRLAEDYAMADILSNGRVIFGLGRGYHTREVETFGSPLIDQAANRELFEEQIDIIFKAFNNESFTPQGQALHAAAGGAVSRLHAEGADAGAAAAAPAGGDAGSRSRAASARALEFMAKHGIQGMVGGGSAEGGAMHKVVLGWQEAHAKMGKHIELGERLCFGFHFYMGESKADGIKRAREILRREHEDVRRAAPGAGDDRRAGRDHARSEARADGEAAADRGRGECRRLPDRQRAGDHRPPEDAGGEISGAGPDFGQPVGRRAEVRGAGAVAALRRGGDAGVPEGGGAGAGAGEVEPGGPLPAAPSREGRGSLLAAGPGDTRCLPRGAASEEDYRYFRRYLASVRKILLC